MVATPYTRKRRHVSQAIIMSASRRNTRRGQSKVVISTFDAGLYYAGVRASVAAYSRCRLQVALSSGVEDVQLTRGVPGTEQRAGVGVRSHERGALEVTALDVVVRLALNVVCTNQHLTLQVVGSESNWLQRRSYKLGFSV